MNLTGNFDKMMDEIKSCYPEYADNEYITFGILIVDPRQRDAQEYIINNFPLFDIHSAGYFNFFIPGFMRGEKAGYPQFKVRGIEYYFDEMIFFAFCEEFHHRFKIAYAYNPMLVLMTMQKGDINTAECIVIELDDNDWNSVRRAGNLFDEIFETARLNPNLINIQQELRQTYVKRNWLDIVTSLIDNKWINEIVKSGKELGRYRIRR